MTTPEWTILKLLDWTTAYFTEHGVPNPRLDAELVLGDVLNLKRINLYLNFENPVSNADLARFKSKIQRRAQREPLQYILGHTDFFGRRFVVTNDVLIPRPETEQLVVRALEWLDAHPKANHVLDVGTGSGCIAITLALERPQLQVTAVEVSEVAVEVARRNAQNLGTHLNIVVGPAATMFKFDLIISNPPYIPTAEIADLQPEVSQYEPRLALDGSADGLAFYRKLLQDASSQLNPGGALALEIGAGQGDAILEIAIVLGTWQTPHWYNDLSDIERILFFELKG